MKFAEKEELRALHKVMMEHFDKERGFTFTRLDVERVTGLDDCHRLRYVIAKFKRKMLKLPRGIQVLWLPNEGHYRLLTNVEQTTIGIDSYTRKAFKAVNRSKRSADAVDASKLSLHDRRLLLAKQDGIKLIKRRMIQSRNSITSVIRKTETNPQRPRQLDMTT